MTSTPPRIRSSSPSPTPIQLVAVAAAAQTFRSPLSSLHCQSAQTIAARRVAASAKTDPHARPRPNCRNSRAALSSRQMRSARGEENRRAQIFSARFALVPSDRSPRAAHLSRRKRSAWGEIEGSARTNRPALHADTREAQCRSETVQVVARSTVTLRRTGAISENFRKFPVSADRLTGTLLQASAGPPFPAPRASSQRQSETASPCPLCQDGGHLTITVRLHP